MAINELGNYLRARRHAVRSEEVGLARDSGRRVDGLRREEVARLAGISPEYYLRLEQGRDTHPSDQVLRALATALNLDVTASGYLHRVADPPPLKSFAPLPGSLDDEVFAFLDGFDETAAYVINACRCCAVITFPRGDRRRRRTQTGRLSRTRPVDVGDSSAAAVLGRRDPNH